MTITPEQTHEAPPRELDEDHLNEVYERRERWIERKDAAEARRRAAERRIEQCYKHLGLRTLLDEVVAVLAPHFPDHVLTAYGPFGLGGETAIYLAPRHDPEATAAGVRFRTGAGSRQHLVDTIHNTGRFPPNSLGALNGFNYEESDEPATLADIVAALNDQIDQEGKSL